MKTTSLASAKNHFSALVDEISRTHEQVTVTRNGEPTVVILAVEDLESLYETLDLLTDSQSRTQFDRGREEIARGEYATAEEMATIMKQRRDSNATGAA